MQIQRLSPMFSAANLYRLGLLAIVLLTISASARSAWALDVEFSGRNVRREILALYDSRHEKTPQTTRIHQFTEMPLNWLGYRITYVDVNGPLPTPTDTDRYRGLLTWFIEPIIPVESYLNWLDQVTAIGLKYVFLAEMAPPEPASAMALMTRILARIGLQPTNQFVAVTHKLSLTNVDTAMMGFERPIDKALPDFRVFNAIPGKSTVHFGAKSANRHGEINAALVTTSKGGGYASDEYTIYYEPNTERVRWTLNPFVFFKQAFGDERLPVPDVTTISGRRMYFSHVDGDGWNNVSEIEGFRQGQVLSAEVIRREVIEPYPDLPVSVGVIAGDVIPNLGGTLVGRDVARKIYALPQVEIASHTYSHPFDWKFYETYDRSKEVKLIEMAAQPPMSVLERVRGAMFKSAGKTMTADKSNKYIAGSSDLPRTYLKDPFDLTKEVQGALALAESLSPPGKKAMLYLWSGDTTPFEGAIAATRAAGVRNINGGDSRLDKEYPSVFYVPPISRPVGRQRQIFAANSNENTYTNDWLGPYYGFFMLEHTLDNTETPRRLKPFNLYYHMYSGEKPAALASIKHFVNLARTSDVIPVTTSRYAGIADDFFRVEIEQIDIMSWAIVNRGTLETVRFDDADGLLVDMSKSLGVLGSNRHQSALYVALDSAIARPIVTLATRTDPVEPVGDAPVASLLSARWTFSNRIDQPCGFSIDAQGFGPGEMTWQFRPNRAMRITTERRGVRLSEEIRWADATGLLKVRIEASANEPLNLRFECHD